VIMGNRSAAFDSSPAGTGSRKGTVWWDALLAKRSPHRGPNVSRLGLAGHPALGHPAQGLSDKQAKHHSDCDGAMTDASSGVLRREVGVQPPGEHPQLAWRPWPGRAPAHPPVSVPLQAGTASRGQASPISSYSFTADHRQGFESGDSTASSRVAGGCRARCDPKPLTADVAASGPNSRTATAFEGESSTVRGHRPVVRLGCNPRSGRQPCPRAIEKPIGPTLRLNCAGSRQPLTPRCCPNSVGAENWSPRRSTQPGLPAPLHFCKNLMGPSPGKPDRLDVEGHLRANRSPRLAKGPRRPGTGLFNPPVTRPGIPWPQPKPAEFPTHYPAPAALTPGFICDASPKGCGGPQGYEVICRPPDAGGNQGPRTPGQGGAFRPPNPEIPHAKPPPGGALWPLMRGAFGFFCPLFPPQKSQHRAAKAQKWP